MEGEIGADGKVQCPRCLRRFRGGRGFTLHNTICHRRDNMEAEVQYVEPDDYSSDGSAGGGDDMDVDDQDGAAWAAGGATGGRTEGLWFDMDDSEADWSDAESQLDGSDDAASQDSRDRLEILLEQGGVGAATAGCTTYAAFFNRTRECLELLRPEAFGAPR